LLIGWRAGSYVTTDESGAVVGCVAHPDDIEDFEKEMRRQRQKLRKGKGISKMGNQV